MHVLFILLKILGFFLLFLLALLLLVLITPVRYQFQLEKEQDQAPEGKVRVTWLFAAVSFAAGYIGQSLEYQVRIFGLQLLGNQPAFLKKKEEKQKRKSEKKKREKEKREKNRDKEKRDSGAEEKEPELLAMSVDEENTTVNSSEVHADSKTEHFADSSEVRGDSETGHSVNAPEARGDSETGHSGEPEKANSEPEKPEGSVQDGHTKTREETDRSGKKQKKLRSKTRTEENKNQKAEKKTKEKSQGKLSSIISQIKEWKIFFDEIQGRELIEIAWDTVIRILKHVLPRKIRGYLRFGFDDPATTGYVTAAFAAAYPLYGRNFTLEPDFQESCLEAKCRGRGRIRPIFFVYILIRLLLKKSVRNLIKKLL